MYVQIIPESTSNAPTFLIFKPNMILLLFESEGPMRVIRLQIIYSNASMLPKQPKLHKSVISPNMKESSYIT